METEKIREAVLEKAKREAQAIIDDADATARALIEKALERKDARQEAQQKRRIADAKREAARITARASIEARKIILREKTAIIEEVLTKVRQRLSKEGTGIETLRRLIDEITGILAREEQIILFVSEKDREDVKKLIAADKAIEKKIAEVRERNSIGGVAGETMDGMVFIDNTFDMRLTLLLPAVLPDMGRTLFGEKDE